MECRLVLGEVPVHLLGPAVVPLSKAPDTPHCSIQLQQLPTAPSTMVEGMLHLYHIQFKFGENSDGIVALHMSEQLSQVPHCPLGVPAGDPLKHGFQRALALLHGVGVSDPGGGEGAVRRQMFGGFNSMALWIQQHH